MSSQPTTQLEKPRRILLDCTSTYRFDANTGLQRVTRNIVNTAPAVGRTLDLECQPVVFDPWIGYRTADGILKPAPSAPALQLAQRRWGHREQLKRVLASTGLLSQAVFAARAARHGLEFLQRPLRRLNPRSVRFGNGDVLLLLDNSWSSISWHEVCRAKRCGARLGVVVYDLIPLLYPHFVGEPAAGVFRRWWKTVCTLADFVICISQSVWHEVEVHQHVWATKPLRLHGGSFRLGAELDGCTSATGIRGELQEVYHGIQQSPVYLMVGTLNPRKNYTTAIEAFQQRWQQGRAGKLLLVGKYGWDSHELVQRIRAHPQTGRRLFWLDDINDTELDFCYRHSAALITASSAEGFNLPIVEALNRGCVVLASDIAVHREVAGPFAAYFPIGDAGALAELLDRHQESGLASDVKSPQAFRWPDWTESSRELLETIIELSSRIHDDTSKSVLNHAA